MSPKKIAVAKMKPLALALLTCLVIAHALDAGAVGAIDHITEGQNLAHGVSLVSCVYKGQGTCPCPSLAPLWF
jgi:hypothetical protein